MTYGLITPTDGANLEFCIRLAFKNFETDYLSLTEIGVHDGRTARGIKAYVESLDKQVLYTGIDSQTDFEVKPPFPEARFIVGYSNEVYNRIADNSQHIIIVDGSHSLTATAVDFLLYKSKVASKGLMIFHDTGKHIKPFTDYQNIGIKENPDNWIACRSALSLLGLFDSPETRGFKLILDEADDSYHTGGYTAFMKL